MNAVPIPAGAAAANGQYSIVIFYRAKLDVVFVVHKKSQLQIRKLVGGRALTICITSGALCEDVGSDVY